MDIKKSSTSVYCFLRSKTCYNLLCFSDLYGVYCFSPYLFTFLNDIHNAKNRVVYLFIIVLVRICLLF